MDAETFIHRTAVVEDGAVLGRGVRVGPFCLVGPQAVLGDGVELISHVSVLGQTSIGAGTKVHPHAALGGPPQVARDKGEGGTLTIGKNCVIRESATFHLGSTAGSGKTVVGDGGFFLAYSHVAHDCIVGNNVTLTHGATLGGHSEIGDNVIVGGLAAVHQFVRVGHHAFVGGMSAVVGDVIPFGMAVGNRARLRGLNIVGMRRSGMQRAQIHQLREAYRRIFDPERKVAENVALVVESFRDDAAVMDIVTFMTSRGKRHFCVPPYLDAGDPGDDAAA